MRIGFSISLEKLVCLMVIVNFAFYNYSYVVIAVQLLTLGMVIYTLTRQYLQGLTYSYIKWWIPFFLFCAMSGFWGGFKQTYFSMLISIAQCIVIGLSITLYNKSKEDIEKLLRTIIIAGVLLVIRLVANTPISAWGSDRFGSHIGYGPNTVGIIMAICFITAIFLCHQNRKLLYFGFVLLFLIIIALSGSKKSLLCAVIGSIAFLMFSSKKKSKKLTILLASVAIISLVWYLMMTIPVLYSSIGIRFEALLATVTGKVDIQSRTSSTDRIRMVQSALEVFKSHPVWGIGIDGFRYVNPILNAYAHNNYVELLADYGMIGFVLYYSFLIFNTFKAFLLLDKVEIEFRPYLAFELAAFLFMFILDFGCVSYIEESPQIFIAVALTMGEICNYYYEAMGDVNH